MKPLDYCWGHAVNSQALLDDVKRGIHDAISSSGWSVCSASAGSAPSHCVDAVEADVIWSSAQQIAVMGHPPQTDGELSLATFLDEMLSLATVLRAAAAASSPPSTDSSAPLIVKLDFKSEQAFRASYELLRAFIAAFPFPRGVFINADILAGPANSSDTAFSDASAFLREAIALGSIDGSNNTYANKIVLSVGWTTSNATEEEFRRGYSHEMVDAMLQVLAPYNGTVHVTFPIRATSVRSSWDALQKLLAASRSFGFTLWWAKTQLDDAELEWLYATLEERASAASGHSSFADRTFYDILGFDGFLQRRLQR